MNRDYITKLLANAKQRDTMTVHLPVCGEDIELFTSLNREQQLRVVAHAGVGDDAWVQAMVDILRFLLIDDNGQLLLKSWAEASGFVNSLDPDDMAALFDAVATITKPVEEQAEAGKAS